MIPLKVTTELFDCTAKQIEDGKSVRIGDVCAGKKAMIFVNVASA